MQDGFQTLQYAGVAKRQIAQRLAIHPGFLRHRLRGKTGNRWECFTARSGKRVNDGIGIKVSIAHAGQHGRCRRFSHCDGTCEPNDFHGAHTKPILCSIVWRRPLSTLTRAPKNA